MLTATITFCMIRPELYFTKMKNKFASLVYSNSHMDSIILWYKI